MKRPAVWVLFAIYIFFLSFFTFGEAESSRCWTLRDVGLKSVGPHGFDCVPNYGGFFAYLLGGTVIAYVLEKSKKTSNNENEK